MNYKQFLESKKIVASNRGICDNIEINSMLFDIVFSPFAGIGSEGYQALKMNRKFIGIELKKEYFETAVKNLNDADNSAKQEELI
jgi:DNA modification methylase